MYESNILIVKDREKYIAKISIDNNKVSHAILTNLWVNNYFYQLQESCETAWKIIQGTVNTVGDFSFTIKVMNDGVIKFKYNKETSEIDFDFYSDYGRKYTLNFLQFCQELHLI